jgi:hypothetical protein
MVKKLRDNNQIHNFQSGLGGLGRLKVCIALPANDQHVGLRYRDKNQFLK